MTLKQYISAIDARYKLGNATEHTFRGDLAQLIEALVPEITATNEPKRQACGAPDYILTKNNIPVGFIEAKDIGDKDLDGTKKTGNKEQFDRYKASLGNLIFTDYLNFHLYRDGEFITKIAVGELTDKGIKSLADNFSAFENLIKDFATHIGQTIKNPKRLAEMMAGKARLLSDIIAKALTSDEDKDENSTLREQKEAFKEILIHDITPKGFADVYAQTIAYGMFAARLHDPTPDTFSRQEAAELIPKSNPFLRKLFGYIAGPDIDDRIKWVVDSLTDIFLACNVTEILKSYGKQTKTEAPIIHFYETFLSEYDPKLRKARGVWYTPAPVVNFIVRAVDDILKTEFDLPQGLADTSKAQIKTADKQGNKGEEEVHKVQILDPATGTGTFLAEVVKHIHNTFAGQQGIWSNYVETHLLPRLNGFELLMASYAMAHLQLELLLTETGYKSTENKRLRIFLTNSLEEHHPDTTTWFAKWLSTEANEANHIKRDTPVMVVMGNPPYSGISSNNGKWINSFIEDYKYIDGIHFNERKHWLNDDYVKFLRYGQYFIEKNKSGILAYINPHGFLDNPTFRGMRWNLLKAYDKIYTIDLHGNSKKKETAPDGSIDQNVFDIMQGVSINIFIKTGKKKKDELGKVFHYDLYGKRKLKYDFLTANSLRKIAFNEITYTKPFYFFRPKDESQRDEYEKGFRVDDLFLAQSMGITSARDSFVIDFEKNKLSNRVKDFCDKKIDLQTFQIKYKLKDNYQWKVFNQRNLVPPFSESFIMPFSYRPFDNRYIYFQNNLVFRMRSEIMDNFKKENIGFCTAKLGRNADYHNYFVTKNITDKNISSSLDNTNIFPLYLYPEITTQQSTESTPSRTPNLNSIIVKQIKKSVALTFTNEKEDRENTFAPIDILDYIYAVLHSPNYREQYKEFLKIEFPRVPYPKDKNTFWQLVHLGGQIRQIHLLESPVVENYITQYPADGDNKVTRPVYKNGNVYINDVQYFANVPEIAWNFYIGGYQPAQKWLKDRKDRILTFEDILHYQKIIVALTETDKLMHEIDEVLI
ncbi:putative helicase [Bacteroidales bacterium Barb6]|nr:putative helicase [Bacteroidales bacterium Barb6]